jgi:hypothetical protein
MITEELGENVLFSVLKIHNGKSWVVTAPQMYPPLPPTIGVPLGPRPLRPSVVPILKILICFP